MMLKKFVTAIVRHETTYSIKETKPRKKFREKLTRGVKRKLEK